MKNISKMMIASFLSLSILTGCTSNSPKGAAEGYLNAIKDGNIENFNKYATDSTRSLISFSLSVNVCKGLNLKDDNQLSECFKKAFSEYTKFKAVDVEDKSKLNAVVTVDMYKKDASVEQGTVNVEKIGEQWKVNMKK